MAIAESIRDNLPCNGKQRRGGPAPATKVGDQRRELHDAPPDDLEEK